MFTSSNNSFGVKNFGSIFDQDPISPKAGLELRTECNFFLIKKNKLFKMDFCH